VGQAIDRINKIQTLSATIVPFIYAFVTTDSRDKVAMRAMSEFEQASLPMRKLSVQFEAWIGRIAPKLDKVVKANKSAAAHEFMLKESAEQSKYLMSDSKEGLAAELT
jgi:oligoendopeptidase F